MSDTIVFYLYILPFLIAALGWGIVLLNDWNDRRHRRMHPGE
ncbi:hypothetical protein [Rhizobium sp. C1]|nr:hypothetical protein [Rhizobium sp. C1]